MEYFCFRTSVQQLGGCGEPRCRDRFICREGGDGPEGSALQDVVAGDQHGVRTVLPRALAGAVCSMGPITPALPKGSLAAGARFA